MENEKNWEKEGENNIWRSKIRKKSHFAIANDACSFQKFINYVEKKSNVADKLCTKPCINYHASYAE